MEQVQVQLSEKDRKVFKKWLTGCLSFGPVTVTFTKKDGSERVMECTTAPSLVPQEPIVEDAAPKREKKVNEDICPVYDMDAKGWRSFRWDSIKNVKLEIK